MKKALSFLLLFALLSSLLGTLTFASAAGPGGSISVYFYSESAGRYENLTDADLVALTLNGSSLSPGDVPALVQYPVPGGNGRTLVPVRLVAEQLGAQVLWVSENRQVILLREEDTIVLTLGSATALVNGQSVELPGGVPAGVVKYQGKESTMVPLRFVSEQLGAQVEWDNATFTATILTEQPEPEPTPEPEPGLPDLGLVTDIISDSDAQTVQIVTDHTPKYQVLDLGDRLVVDVLGTQMPDADYLTHTITVDNDFITSVRYAQHGNDLGYGYEHSVRVVLDLKKGVTYAKNITVSGRSDGVLLTAYKSEEGGTDFTPSTPIDPSKSTIVVDPGHGGIHPGAVYEGVQEKDLTLSISLKLRDELVARGYNVVLLREEDITLDIYDRAYIANDLGADLFVSVHCNASGTVPTYQGIYTYYHPSSNRGKRLAEAIQKPLCQITGGIDRGVRSADFVVLRETEMCAVLVETGFMSNSEELARLCDETYQGKLAQGIAEGVVRYLNGTSAQIAEAHE